MIRVKQDLGGQSPGEGSEVGKVLASLKNYTKASANVCSITDYPKMEFLKQWPLVSLMIP